MLFAAEIFWKIICVASCTDSEGPLTVTCRGLNVEYSKSSAYALKFQMARRRIKE